MTAVFAETPVANGPRFDNSSREFFAETCVGNPEATGGTLLLRACRDSVRVRVIIMATVAVGFVAAFGFPWAWGSPRWSVSPAITVVARADDPRLPAVHAAVAHWNEVLAGLPTDFRLGALTRVDGEVSTSDLQALGTGRWWPRGMWLRRHPRPFDGYGGDLVIVLSDGEFISFSSRIGDRGLVGIKTATHPPLSLPNVLPNVIAHEIGHALGLGHNGDPATLMCGRPASCRPDAFRSDVPNIFPLTSADVATLRERYPARTSAR
jgi:hypothetical protein